MRKATSAESSLRERPISYTPRRLAEWINPTGSKKVHSLVDKVYKPTNLHMAWLKVKENKGSGGIDNQTILDFEGNLTENLQRLHDELKSGTYKAEPVRQHKIPKAGQPGKFRKLGIPTIYDRVCQQALKNRLEPIFETTFDEASFGYRKGRSTKDALRKVWKELESGNCWIVDADLEDFFGTADHEKVLTLLNQQVSDGNVLKLVKQMLKAGCMTDVELVPTETGVPQGGVLTPRTHSQTLSLKERLKLTGENFDNIIKSITFMANEKITELGIGKTDQLYVYDVAKGQTPASNSGKADTDVWGVFHTGLSLYLVGQRDQRKNGDTGKFCGVYGQTATITNQADKTIIGFQRANDQQSGSYCVGRIFSKSGLCQKRRNKLGYHLPMTGCGSKNSHRFIICLYHPMSQLFSPNNVLLN